MADYYTHFSFVVPFEAKAAKVAVATIRAERDRCEAAQDALDSEVTSEIFDGDVWSFPRIEAQADGIWFEDDLSGALDVSFDIVQWLLNQPGANVDEVFIQWTETCSKPRVDAYGGGAALVTKDDIQSMGTIGLLPLLRRQAQAKEFIYDVPTDRWLAELRVSYADSADDDSGVAGAIEAAAAALGLTTDDGSSDTIWCVTDRTTGTVTQFEQSSLGGVVYDDEAVL